MNLITCRYYAYANAYILVHLSVFEFDLVGLAFFRFTLTKGIGVPENYVLINHIFHDLSFVRISMWN